ncbi:hypothetical protein NL676_021071 [Syzygium grande]|nr:hypothetical protein NL676_021071 [Syzygium grande]
MAFQMERTTNGRQYKVKDMSQANLGGLEIELTECPNARPHVLPLRVRTLTTPQGRENHRLRPHDHRDCRPHRDPHRPQF